MMPISRGSCPVAIAGLIALAVGLSCPAPAQIPAGIIYQAAVESGMGYVNPITGQAIVNQKSALNLKSFLAHAATDGSIGVLTAGLGGLIHMGTALEAGLAGGHVFADKEITPLLAVAAPNPNDLPPVLQMTASMSPTAAACAENTIYAPRAKSLGPVMINGYAVTFSYQGEQVLRHVDGRRLKQFQAVDVVACVPGTIVFPGAPAAQKTTAAEIPPPDNDAPPVWYLASGLRDEAARPAWSAR
jgi:hypothetical protein